MVFISAKGEWREKWRGDGGSEGRKRYGQMRGKQREEHINRNKRGQGMHTQSEKKNQ